MKIQHRMMRECERASEPVLVMLLVALLSSACAPFERPNSKHVTQSLPPQGLYEGCVPHEDPSCVDHLTPIAQAGFKFVLNYDLLYFTEEEVRTYTARAQALGIEIIWAVDNPVFWDGTDLRSYFSGLAATCECSDNRGFIRYVVGLAKHLPATWGYYVGDEVKSEDHARMKVYAELVHQFDPGRPTLFVGIGAPDASNLAPFADTAQMLGADYYPVSDPDGSLSMTGPVARATQALADRNGKQPAMVLQAFSWAQYPRESWSCSPFPGCARFPTRDEMRQMRDLALRYSHPSILLWYSYFDILHSPNPSAHWADLVAAADVRPVP